MKPHLLPALLCGVVFTASCEPSTGSTSFSTLGVAARTAAEIADTSSFVPLRRNDGRLFSEDNVGFSLRLMNCAFSVRTARGEAEELSESELTEGTRLSPVEALLVASLQTDLQEEVFRAVGQVAGIQGLENRLVNTFVGVLQNPTPIRITDQWPVESLPCNDTSPAVILIRRVRASADVTSTSPNANDLVMVRVVTGSEEALRSVSVTPSIFPVYPGVMTYDIIMKEDSLTPAQEEEAASVARDVVRGLIRALGRS